MPFSMIMSFSLLPLGSLCGEGVGEEWKTAEGKEEEDKSKRTERLEHELKDRGYVQLT